MSKTYINPNTKDFGILEPSEVEEFYGWVPAEEYVTTLEARVKELEGALEEATAALDFLNSAGHGTKATIRAMLRGHALLNKKG